MDKLLQLLSKVYKLKNHRDEADIGMSEEYWKVLGEFKRVHAEAGFPHVSSEEAKKIAFPSDKKVH